MDRLESMALLLAAVDACSLSAASRHLGKPLATVSRRISELEAHLKTRLINRSSRQLTLTDAGRSYVEACRRILEQVGEAERAAAGEYSAPRGDLTVTAPVVLGRLHVLPIALEFLAAYPDIDLRLVLSDSILNLQESNIDLAVRIGFLPDSSLIAARIGLIRHVLCASPDYLAARGRPETPDDIARHDCITFESLASPRVWSFSNRGSTVSVRLDSRLTVNTAEAAIDAAVAGVGITRVLSYQVAEATRAGTLTLVLEAFEPPPWPVSLVHTGQGLLPLKVRAFLDFTAPRLKALLSGDAHPPAAGAR
jgi:DNA-binding transcriptional LysR family regulator